MRRSVFLTFLVAAFGCVVSATSQTYYVSTPITGYCEVDMDDAAGGVPGQGYLPSGFGSVNFGTLAETLYYDPVANTLEQVGSVSANSGVDLEFADAEYISSGSTQLLLTAQVSANLTIGTLMFDETTGGNINHINSLTIPITGSYALTTGGDEYTGTLNYTLGLPFTTSITSITPTSLTFSQAAVGFDNEGPFLASVSASNGFRLGLVAGAYDNTYDYGWSVGPVTAELVPEPSSFALLVLGAAALTCLYVRERYRHGPTAR